MRTRGADAAGLQGPNASSDLFGPSHQPEIARMRLRERGRGRGKDAGHMLQRRQCCFYFCIFCAPAKAVSDFVPRIVSSSRLFGLAHRLHRACFDSSPQPIVFSIPFISLSRTHHINNFFLTTLFSDLQ